MSYKESYIFDKGKMSDILINSGKFIVLEFNLDGNLTYVNQSGLNLFPNEVTTKNIKEIFEFKINDVLNELIISNEINCEIAVINAKKEFICTKSYFKKENDNIIVILSVLTEDYCKKNLNFKLSQTLNKISNILNSSLNPEKVLEIVLSDINDVVSYDKAMIMFLEGENLVLKTSFNLDTNVNVINQGNDFLINILKDKKPIIIDNTEYSKQFLKTIEYKRDNNEAIALIPLVIRESLIGFILLIKQNNEVFYKEDLEILQHFANIVVYALKDSELSNVFKLQLKILKDNVIERTKNLEIIKDQNLKILEADKLKNEFLANMSHELRTPLNAIIGFSEALKLKIFGDLNAKQDEYVGDIYASGVHLLGMINDLLDIAKIEANEMQLCMEEFTVLKAVNEVVNIVNAIAQKKNIEIITCCKDSNLQINADYRRFHQIMYNLLSNSIKFSPEDGKINIGIDKEGNDLIKIFVKDEGEGIDTKYHQKIFEKFQQVDSSYTRKQGSSGLGLTITKELVELHGGKIEVDSQPGKGATFIFYLPVKQ